MAEEGGCSDPSSPGTLVEGFVASAAVREPSGGLYAAEFRDPTAAVPL